MHLKIILLILSRDIIQVHCKSHVIRRVIHIRLLNAYAKPLSKSREGISREKKCRVLNFDSTFLIH